MRRKRTQRKTNNGQFNSLNCERFSSVVRSRSVKPWCILLILGTGRKAKVLGQGPHQEILNEKIPERNLKKKNLF